MLLQLEQVGKTYRGQQGEVHALSGINLELNSGEFVAIRGPSGCGKSTLLMITGGLLAPDSGQVLFEGNNPYTMSAHERAGFRGQSIGFVFQQFHLVPYLSVFDNILAPTLATGGASGEMRRRVGALLDQFGLSGRSEHVPAQLSSGERQRTALARALLNQPKLILADEPTGNLDSENAEIVLDHLKNFAALGGAVLLVTHDDRSTSYSDRVVQLRDGKIVENAE